MLGFLVFLVLLVIVRGVFDSFLNKQASIGYIPEVNNQSLTLMGAIYLSCVAYDIASGRSVELVMNTFMTVLVYVVWIFMIRLTKK